MKTKKKTRLIILFLAVVMAVFALTASISAQAWHWFSCSFVQEKKLLINH